MRKISFFAISNNKLRSRLMINQVRSQNLKQVPQNFMKVFNADDITLERS